MRPLTLLVLALCAPTLALAEDVTIDNLVRAETDHMIRQNMVAFGLEVGQVVHQRDTLDVNNQPVIRMNVDTLYSSLVLDLSKPVEITLPDIDGRYQSMHVIDQDHYMFVEATPGTYRLTEEVVGTRFAAVAFRTFVDPTDAEDVRAARAAQDGISVSGGGSGPFEAPDWDQAQLDGARKAINDLTAAIGFDSRYAFGRRGEVRPVDYVVGALSGWAGLPLSAANYNLGSVEQNDGQTPYAVTVKDVPVDAFWSITVYNADGYMEPNDLGRNSYNNVTAQPNDDGSITIRFGGCETSPVNCIPVTPDWNYGIRLYQPRAEIIDGRWSFPEFETVN